nr:RasGEF [Polyrhizophydium stewartii]
MSKGFGVSKSPTYKDMDYDPEVFDILDISPKDVAKQLTLLSSELFRNITSQELESLAWTGPEKERLTPAIVHITNHFNQIAIWVAQQILDAKAAKRRFQLICFFIRVAKVGKRGGIHCLDFNNFDSVRSVVAGLQSTPVHRLERTQMVGRRERAVFEKIAELASLDNNNDAYRRRLAHAKPPCVPYLGTHLGDLTFVYECLKKDRGNPARAHQYEEREAQDVHYQLSYEIEARAGASSGHGVKHSFDGDGYAFCVFILGFFGDDDSTPDKAAWLAMRKIDFALKTSVGSSGTFSPLASVGRRSKKEKDHDFSSSEMRSWSVPSQRSKRERPRIDALSSSFVGGMMGISQASLLGNTLGRPVATRDRSASSAAETGAKDSYRRKMVEGIMKHIRKGRSKSHSRASSDALTGIYSDLDDDSDGAKGEDGRDRDRGVSKGIDSSEEYFDGHRAESTGRSNLELADAHSASMSSVRAIYHPSEDSSGNKNRRHLRGSSDGRFSYTARTNSAGSPDRCASDGDDGDGDDDDASVSSDGRREPGRPYNLLQGVLSKKEETDELGNRAARRDWVRVWAVLEGGTLTLYRYDKSMKGATFMASSTSRQLKLLQGSLASQPSADRDQSMMGKSLADGLDQGAASPAGAASGGSSVVRETPGRVGWSITDSLADLSFSGTRARARKTRPKDADSEPRGPSPRGQDSGRDLVERIVFNSMTRASQASDYVKRSNVFRLQPVNERSVLMKANSGHEMESWIDAIRATVGELRSTY